MKEAAFMRRGFEFQMSFVGVLAGVFFLGYGTLAFGQPDIQLDTELHVADENCAVIIPQATTFDSQETDSQKALFSDCGDRNVIDVLWVYTPAALADVGSEMLLELFCAINIGDANVTFANSQLPFAVRTVGIVPTEYDESGDHLALIRGESDGVMDEIHAIRDSVAADIVVLITVDGYCGVAYVAPNNGYLGFQKVSSGCLVSTSAFRHELGHNLGSKHWASDPGGFFSYSAGHVLTLGDGSTIGTAMGGNSLPYFSNPRVNYQGVPTGVEVGSVDAADNWLAFMQTVPMVADFRCSGDCNANGIDDATEIASGMVQDCDNNGVPDECQQDINMNGTIDACEPYPVAIRVPEDVPSLQLAISLAESGVHEIVVGPGTWIGPFDTFGKAIVIRSSHGPQATVLDGQNTGRVMSIRSGETPQTVIDGFTISNGAAYQGAGILIENASPIIRNCIFRDNIAEYAGGGMRITDGMPLIIDCVFEMNVATWGGAVSAWSGAPVFERSSFSENTARDAGRGGAISSWTSNTTFIDCEFQKNSSALSGGAIFNVDGGGANAPVIANTRFCNNTPDHINPSQWIDGGQNQFLANCPCPADLTGDGLADFLDISAFLSAFTAGEILADLNNDGFTDFLDISAFLTAFANGCP